MKKICNDFNASEWFDEENGTYIKRRGGVIVGRLRIEDVPNPDELWDKKCISYGVKPKSLMAIQNGVPIRLKPSDAIYELFKYKEGA